MVGVAVEPTPYRWDVRSYQAMITAGILGKEDRVELLDGEIIQMAPMGNPHMASVDFLTRAFVTALGDRAIVRVQGSFVLSMLSMPQPDLLLLRPRRDFYRLGNAAPDDVFLVVEVSGSSRAHDRLRKVPLFAKGGVREAWIVNVPDGTIEVCRRPGPDGYQEVRTAGTGEAVSPEAFPDIAVGVDDVLGLG